MTYKKINLPMRITACFAVVAILSSFAGTMHAKAAPAVQVAAFYSDALARPLATTDTTMTLVRGTDYEGRTLSGTYAFIVDQGNPSQEVVEGSVSGTTVTGLMRGIDSLTGTTTNAIDIKAHTRGASVQITTFPPVTVSNNQLSGVDSIPMPIYYGTVSTSSIAANRQNLADWGLVQDTALQGSGAIAATTAAKGYVQLATGAQAAAHTSLGSSGASLALNGAIASSSSLVNGVPVTNAAGTLDPSFISNLATSTTIGYLPAFLISQQRQFFSSTGTTTFAVPSGVTQVQVQVIAGGATGGSSTFSSNESIGSGGGGGGTCIKNVNVTGTTTIQVFVGAHDQWSTFGTNGFYCSASMGITPATVNTTNGSVVGGIGGTGTGGDLNLQGAQGGTGVFMVTGVPGGKGGDSSMGFGATEQSTGANSTGLTGTNYGGGGSGGVSASSGTNIGGVGAQGIVIVSW